jgi:6-phosphofructokinase 1
VEGFEHGKRLGLMIRNEHANPFYTTNFMCALFEEEGGKLFDVRQAILGHMQQGGDPTPFDRIQATRLATKCIEFLIEEVEANKNPAAAALIGLQAGKVRFSNLEDFPRMIDEQYQRPKEQWWLELRSIAKVLAQPGPQS